MYEIKTYLKILQQYVIYETIIFIGFGQMAYWPEWRCGNCHLGQFHILEAIFISIMKLDN